MVKIGDIVYSKHGIPAKVIDIHIDNSYSNSKRAILEFEWGEITNISVYRVKDYKFGEPDISKSGCKLKTLHKRFDSIQQRCNNKNSISYINYGKRGIKCCFSNFWEFYSYVKNLNKFDEVLKYPNKYQIDRIDTNGNYEKGNLRFVTYSENQRNRRDNYEYIVINMLNGNILYEGILTDVDKFIHNYTGCKTHILDNKGLLKYNIGLKNGFRLRVEYKDKVLQSEYSIKFKQHLDSLGKFKCYTLVNTNMDLLCFGTLNMIKNYLKLNYNVKPHLTESNIESNKFINSNNLCIQYVGHYNRYEIEKKIYNLL